MNSGVNIYPCRPPDYKHEPSESPNEDLVLFSSALFYRRSYATGPGWEFAAFRNKLLIILKELDFVSRFLPSFVVPLCAQPILLAINVYDTYIHTIGEIHCGH